MTEKKKVYRIQDNEDKRHPWCLVDENDVVILVSHRKSELVDYAFDELGAWEVRHEESPHDR